MSVETVFIMILIGIFTGVVTGLTGASGVMVVVPLVNIFLSFSIHEAIGTSLIVDVLSPLAISYIYYKHGNLDIKSGIWIAIGSILGAQLGAGFAAGIPEMGLSGAFGIFMIIMGVIIWQKGLSHQSLTKIINKTVKFENPIQQILIALVLGFVIGIMTGVLGAGGGGMILIILLFVLNFPLHKAIGTSSLIMAITACSGAVGYALHGNIQPIAGLILGTSAAASGMASARFANKVNEKILSKIVGIIFIILGGMMTVLYLKK